MIRQRSLPKGLAHSLKDLWDAGASGYWFMECFRIVGHRDLARVELNVPNTDTQLLVVHRDLLFSIWKTLKPYESEIVSVFCLVDSNETVAYEIVQGKYQMNSAPIKIFGEVEISKLLQENRQPFRWTDPDIGHEGYRRIFNQNIEEARKK